MKLQILNKIPDNFCESLSTEIHSLLRGPTLIDLPGESNETLFISVLLHGNEFSGLQIIQNVFKQLENISISRRRGLLVFIGNTLAASEGKRHLEDQSDFNRVWSGGNCPLAQIAQEVKDYSIKKQLLYSIDIHNNIGRNPHYGCINKLDHRFLSLARFFFKPIVYFTEPHEVQSMAYSQLCPSVTLETGQPGDIKGVRSVTEKLLLLLDRNFSLPDIHPHELQVYHTVARMKFTQNAKINFSFSESKDYDFAWKTDIDLYNFKKIPVGEVLAFVNGPNEFWIEQGPRQGKVNDFFSFENNQLIVKNPFIPAMISTDPRIIKDDCFGYIMEEYKL